MKKFLPYILVLVILCAGFYFFASSGKSDALKCPDDYADDDAGSAAYVAATNKWTNDFYDAHPGATLADWSAARYQFWLDHHCTAALQRYQDAKDGKANPATMEWISNDLRAINGPVQ